MIRFGWEKKRRKKQGINDICILKASINEGIANVFQIMIEDIVTANIFRPIEKLGEVNHRIGVK